MPLSPTLDGIFGGLALKFQDRKVLAYLGVSVAALSLDVGLYSLANWMHIDRVLASAVGYVAGLCLHFVLSRYLVFQSKRKGRAAMVEGVNFLISGLLGLCLTSTIVFVSTHFLHLSSGPAKICAVAISFLGVFIMRSVWVFADARDA